MYTPKAFEVSDTQTIYRFVEAHSFATLVSNSRDGIVATHVPMLLDQSSPSSAVLVGHLARANSQWRDLEHDSRVLAIFNGPHAYISPSWYAAAPAVPTWNYGAVHIHGSARVFDDSHALVRLLDRMIAKYDPNLAGRIPDDFRDKLLRAIVGIAIAIDRIEAKFKLSQNRSLDDQRGMLAGLEAAGDTGSHELAAFARSYLGLSA